MGAVVRRARGDSWPLANGGVEGAKGTKVGKMKEVERRPSEERGGGDRVNGTTNGVGRAEGDSKGTRFVVDVRIPEKVIEEGVRVVREALEDIVEVGGNGS